MGARFPTGWIYETATLDEELQRVRDAVDATHGGPTSSLDQARAEREADYSPARRFPCPPLSAAPNPDSVRCSSRDAARVPPSFSDARRDRGEAA